MVEVGTTLLPTSAARRLTSVNGRRCQRKVFMERRLYSKEK
jgi:hypothetical protein